MTERATTGGLLDEPRMYGLLRGIVDPVRIAPMRRLLGRVPHASLLDLGCGIGDLCGMTPATYTGVDASTTRIAYARRHYGIPGRRFEAGDALALDASLGHHDVVALINVVHHFSDEEVRRCLDGLKVVTPARLFLVDVALERTGWLFRRVFAPLDRGRYFRTTADLKGLLGSAGWAIEWEDRCVTAVGIYPYSVLMAKAPSAKAPSARAPVS